jgi:hypothetical protein
MAIVGFLVFPPLIMWIAILCLTGDIYKNRSGECGNLETWGNFSKGYAVFILIALGVRVVSFFYSSFQ